MKKLYIILLFFQTLNASATTDNLESVFTNAVDELLKTNGGHSCLVNTNKRTRGQYNTFIHIPDEANKPPKVFIIRFDQNGRHCDNLQISTNHQCLNLNFVPNFIRTICNNNPSKLKLESKGFYTARLKLKPLEGTELFLKAAKNMDNTHVKAIYREEGYIFLQSTHDSKGISPARLIVKEGSVYNLTETTEGIRQGAIKAALDLIKKEKILPNQVRSIGLEGRFLTNNMELYIPNSFKPETPYIYTLIEGPSLLKAKLEKVNKVLDLEKISSIKDWSKIYSGLLIRLLDPQYEFPPSEKHLLEKYRFFQHLLLYLEKYPDE